MRVLTDPLAGCRLAPDSPWPVPPADRSFFAAVRTADEISVVVSKSAAPAGARIETNWRALEVAGPLDFALVGVISALTAPLADVAVSVFVVSTYDTYYLLIHAAALEQAVAALRGAGHIVHAG